MVADLTIVGVPLIAQFVVLKVKPVSVAKFGDMLQEVTVPDTVGFMMEIRAPWVKTNGDPV